MMLWGYNMTLSALLCSGNCSEVQFFLKSTNFGYTKDTSFFIWSISKQVFLTIFLIGTLSKKDLAAYHFSYQILHCCHQPQRSINHIFWPNHQTVTGEFKTMLKVHQEFNHPWEKPSKNFIGLSFRIYFFLIVEQYHGRYLGLHFRHTFPCSLVFSF